MDAPSPQAIAWIFENLGERPFGVLPLANLNSKGGPTVLENYEQAGSYNWVLDESKTNSTLLVPGLPKKLQLWNGGRLDKDVGPILYDVNHMMAPQAPLDPIILAMKKLGDSDSNQINFQQFDLITDAMNLVKIFAFTKGEGGGMFRIDLERVGRTILATRVEAADVVPIDFTSFDLGLRDKCTKAASNKSLDGPYEQLAKYQLGELQVLVRFEPECADYAKLPSGTNLECDLSNLEKNQPFDLNKELHFIEFGTRPDKHELLQTVAFPQNDGFPEFTYSKIFFTGIDRLLVGSWKGVGDFAPPKAYTMSDIIKIVKPQQAYNQISKTYDCLLKVTNLLRKNPESLKISLVWSGSDFLEIYEKSPETQSPISDSVKAFLKTQVTEKMPGDVDELDNVD